MEKNFALYATKKINILTLVLSERKILNEAKNHNPPPPPLQVKWSAPKQTRSKILIIYMQNSDIWTHSRTAKDS